VLFGVPDHSVDESMKFPTGTLIVTKFDNRASGNEAFALIASSRDRYAHRTIHTLGRHIAARAAVCGKLVLYGARSVGCSGGVR
jgi:hypothetical protein